MSPLPQEPFLLDFDKIGDKSTGYIVTTQKADLLPFAVRRVFWTFGTPVGVERGGHANKTMEELLVAVQGTVQVRLHTVQDQHYKFILDSPSQGLYVPPLSWIIVRCDEASVLLSLASTDFEEEDYMRDFADFGARISGK
ncbi:N/A [soil metagenome]|jgi:hypothetical protein